MVWFLDDDTSRRNKLTDIKNRAGLTDVELKIVKGKVPKREDHSTFAFGGSTDVHYMRLRTTEGRDYDVLKTFASVLGQVWVIDFIYDFQGEWKTGGFV